MKVNLPKKNGERVLSGTKWMASLSENYLASLNNDTIKPTSSVRRLTEAFLLIPIIIPTAITLAWVACTYFF